MRPAVVGAALAVALAACSGGSSAADAWRAGAAKACDTRAEAVRVASAQLTASSTPEQFAAWFRQFFAPAYRAQLASMADPAPPDATAKALVDDTTEVIDAMAADPASYAVAADPFEDVDARWDAYGLQACGSRTSGSSTLSSTGGPVPGGSSAAS